ncbi:MAG TPA: cupin domain-containing protein [Terriglobia bacterium]|nr:cupin domain-containing protein [Terriglobia bacterium]
MHKTFLIALLLASLASGQTAQKKSSAATPKPSAVIVTPDKINWGDAPPVLNPGARMAVLSGNPNGPGEYVIRLKMPDGYKVMPHWHPTQENVTVVSGEFHVAMGGKWDDSKFQSLPPGSFAAVPAHHHHYAMAKGDTEIQVNGLGPFKLVYVNPADDPSKKK